MLFRCRCVWVCKALTRVWASYRFHFSALASATSNGIGERLWQMCAVSRAHSVTHACQCCRRPASTAAAAIYQVFCGLRRPDRLGDPGSPRRVWLPAVHPRRASDRSRSLRPQVGQTRPCSAIGPAGIVQATTSVPLAPHTPGFWVT